MDTEQLKPILEALFSATEKPLAINFIYDLFSGDIDQPSKDDIRQAIHELVEKYESAGLELKQVASGFKLDLTTKLGLPACGIKSPQDTHAHCSKLWP